MFNSKGPHSLYANLNNHGFIKECRAFIYSITQDSTIFSISAILTQSGKANVTKIIYSIFDWLNKLLTLCKNNKILQFYKDTKNFSEYTFQYHQPLNNTACTIQMPDNLLYYDIDNVVVGDSKLEEINILQLENYLNIILSQDRLRTFLSTNESIGLSRNTNFPYNVAYNNIKIQITDED